MRKYKEVTKDFDDKSLGQLQVEIQNLINRYGPAATLKVTERSHSDDWGYVTRGEILLYYQGGKGIK